MIETRIELETEFAPAEVGVVIPCRAEYVAIARLAILGVANRLQFSYDEVEDVRLAVGEACTHAVERAQFLSDSDRESRRIWIDSLITPRALTIQVRDDVPQLSADIPIEDFDDDSIGFDKQDLGALLIEILVDEVAVESDTSGTTVRLVKRAPSTTNGSIPPLSH